MTVVQPMCLVHTVIEKLEYSLLRKFQRDMHEFSVVVFWKMGVFSNGSSFVSKKEVFLFLKMGVCFLKGRAFLWLTLGWIMMPAVPEMDISLKIESTNYHAIGNLMLFMNTNVIIVIFPHQ